MFPVLQTKRMSRGHDQRNALATASISLDIYWIQPLLKLTDAEWPVAVSIISNCPAGTRRSLQDSGRSEGRALSDRMTYVSQTPCRVNALLCV